MLRSAQAIQSVLADTEEEIQPDNNKNNEEDEDEDEDEASPAVLFLELQKDDYDNASWCDIGQKHNNTKKHNLRPEVKGRQKGRRDHHF